MKRSFPWTALIVLVLAAGLLVTGCQKKEAPAETAAQPAAKPPPPPPPPDTSLGKLIGVARVDSTEVQVLCSNPRGAAFVTSRPIEPSTGSGGKLKANPGAEVFTAGIDTMCKGTETETAGEGRKLAVLKFEGAGRRSLSDDLVTWVTAPQSKYLSRVDDKSWLSDGAGKEYKKAFVVATKEKRQLAFLIPADATGLVWHDGKKMAFQLEPHPVAVEQAAAAPARKTQ